MTAPPRSRLVADLVEEIAADNPRRLAVIARDRAQTYAELAGLGARAAAGLASIGVRRHDRVGLLCTNRPEWIVVLLAGSRLGASIAAFDTWSRGWDLEYLLENSGASVLVTLDRFRAHAYVDDLRKLVPELDDGPPGSWRSQRFPKLREVIVIGEEVPRGARRLAELLRHGELAVAPPGERGSAGDVAFVLYTSGSTSRPKGVPLLEYAAIENGFNIGERMGLRTEDRVWVSVPLFWSYGSANALMATLTHGATIVLQEVFEPEEALDLIEAHRCTAAYTLPNITTRLIDHPAFSSTRTASLRTGLTIGAPEDVRRAADGLGIAGICNVYGATETYGNCCVTPTELPLETRMICQGPPLPGMRLRIVDPETDREQQPGEPGDVLVGGYVTPGYVNNEALTGEAFTPDGFYRTGDVGFLDDEGRFHFVARASEMIKTGGINVSPLEVESFLLNHPAVRGAAVVGRSDLRAGQLVVAYVELSTGADASSEDLRVYCRAGMASYKVPAEIVICDELPRTDTGKLDRRTVRAWAGGAEDERAVAP